MTIAPSQRERNKGKEKKNERKNKGGKRKRRRDKRKEKRKKKNYYVMISDRNHDKYYTDGSLK